MENIKFVIEKSARIDKLIDELYAKMPEIESARGVLVTESYKATEALPIINRRSAAFAHILRNIPIIIRDGELIVGSATLAPHGCQVFPEYSYEWLEAEFDTVATRAADPFYISEKTKAELRAVYPYWKGGRAATWRNRTWRPRPTRRLPSTACLRRATTFTTVSAT